jgi:ketosteroid isomerase-like protein
MSDGSSPTLAQQGFDAWRRGDFEALEQMFAPDVEGKVVSMQDYRTEAEALAAAS